MNTAPQPTDWHHIWLCVKSLVEFLYFIAGVVLIGVAVYAARQVKFAAQQTKLAADHAKIASDQLDATRQIAKDNAKRDAVRLAGEHCKYFAEIVVPAWGQAETTYVHSRCTFLDPVPLAQGANPAPAFVINNGDFAQPTNYDMSRITDQCWGACGTAIVDFLNKLESFAIPFAMGVAHDPTGFQETAPVFINILNKYTPAIYYLRMTQGSRYPSILKLFNVWHQRVVGQALAQMMPGMQRMVDDAQHEIPPL